MALLSPVEPGSGQSGSLSLRVSHKRRETGDQGSGPSWNPKFLGDFKPVTYPLNSDGFSGTFLL